jgi:uncharacterized DUF497 family protein
MEIQGAPYLFILRIRKPGRKKGNEQTGIITYRGNKTRIISVRRSRKEEVDIYESYQG